jgi:hypothetical protein
MVTLKATEITYDNSSWLSLVEQDGQTQIIALKKSDGWWYTQPSATGASLWYKTPAQVGVVSYLAELVLYRPQILL